MTILGSLGVYPQIPSFQMQSLRACMKRGYAALMKGVVATRNSSPCTARLALVIVKSGYSWQNYIVHTVLPDP
jgi:hypothetical protein